MFRSPPQPTWDLTLTNVLILKYIHVCLNECAGKNSYMWLGPCPRVHIMDPEQLKATFSLMDDIQKPDNNPLIDYLLEGILTHEGGKWTKHRKIISPAFHLDKLKVSFQQVLKNTLTCNLMI